MRYLNGLFSIFAFFISFSLLAQNTETTYNGMPSPPQLPTQVRMAIFLTDIDDINELAESMEVELTMVLNWKDPRLAFDPQKEGVAEKRYQGKHQFEDFPGWWPQIIIINGNQDRQTEVLELLVSPDGSVKYSEQFHVTAEMPLTLKKFPFDQQKFKLFIEAFGNTTEQVVFTIDPTMQVATQGYATIEEHINVAQWKLLGVSALTRVVPELSQTAKKNVSQFVLQIELTREPQNIVWKILFPLIILVMLTWSIFLMDKENLKDRLDVSFIAILSIVAYQLLISSSLPRIAYFTLTDAFLLFTFLFMGLTVIESLLVDHFKRSNKDELAHRIDKISLWLFPFTFFSGLGIIGWWFLS